MRFHKIPFFLKFKYPFKLASNVREGTDNLYVRVENEGVVGWGEAVFPPYLSETVKSAKKALKSVSWVKHDSEFLFDLIARNHSFVKDHPAAACAMEVCLLNWMSAKEGKSINELINLPLVEKPTSYTIGICSSEEMIARIQETPEATYFKLKVNEEEIDRIVSTYTSNCDKPFVVDANQGFTSRDKALEWGNKLHEIGVEYFEQPFHKEDLGSHAWLKERVSIPIIADESFQRIGDLDKVEEAFDGINVKIMKSGGVLEAKAALYKAKARGLKTIVGCMSGSSVSINAAKALTSLANYVDLDGIYLITNDPFDSGEYETWVKEE